MVKEYSFPMYQFIEDFSELSLIQIAKLSLDKARQSPMWMEKGNPVAHLFYYTSCKLGGEKYNIAVEFKTYQTPVPQDQLESVIPSTVIGKENITDAIKCRVELLHIILTDEALPDEVMDAFNKMKDLGKKTKEDGGVVVTLDENKNFIKI